MLNLLISILGNSFSKFQLSKVQIDYKEMIDIIKEVETVMLWKRNNDKRGHLVVCDISDGKNECNPEEEHLIAHKSTENETMLNEIMKKWLKIKLCLVKL